MPRDKDLKRLVRSRMKKTGESYTTARSHLLDKKQALPANYAELAGYSDNTVNEKTGRSRKQWVRLLDAWRATEWKHTEIVRQVTKQGVSAWWAQTVTIGYERIRGLREIGQVSTDSTKPA